jgi:acetyl esterase/lipase
VKRAAAVAAVGVAALAARRYLAMREALAQVEPELRNPVLPFVTVNYSDKTLPAIRLAYRVRSSPGSGVNVVTRMVGDPQVRVLVTTPDGHQAKRPAVLSLHGGGMIVGSPQLELMTHGRLARDLGAVVVAPDYQPGAREPFPCTP